MPNPFIAGGAVHRTASANGVVAAGTGAGQSKYQACSWVDSILITAAGTVALTVYDNAGPAGTATGNVVAIIPAAGQAVGQRIQVSAAITAGGASFVTANGTPAITFFYD